MEIETTLYNVHQDIDECKFDIDKLREFGTVYGMSDDYLSYLRKLSIKLNYAADDIWNVLSTFREL